MAVSLVILAIRQERRLTYLKPWVPVSLGILVVFASVFIYLTTSDNQGGNSFQLVNSVGLVAVIIGIIAAGIILKRATPRS